MSLSVHEVRERLHRRLIPALPVPFTQDRSVHDESHVSMAKYLTASDISGVAVWAHTGRGLLLTEDERTAVLVHWREALPNGVIIAGAGGGVGTSHAGEDSDDAYFNRAKTMAEHATSLGADAILCYAPTRFRDRTTNQQREAIVHYHQEIAAVGLPIILFYLYEAAGGISYSTDVLNDLFQLPNVIGIKMATLDSVMTYQNVAAFIHAEFPEQMLITGEDRFLGFSLMIGADAALIGMGGALTKLQSDMMRAYYNQHHDSFHQLSRLVDRFSHTTFIPPMEGYIARMLYVMSRLGIVSPDAIFDPWGPPLPQSDFDAIDAFLASLPPELRR